jgi:hypothetical protein
MLGKDFSFQGVVEIVSIQSIYFKYQGLDPFPDRPVTI